MSVFDQNAPEAADHAVLLFHSYRKVTGRFLGDESWSVLDPTGLLTAMNSSPLVIASHGTEKDPVLNFGNRSALELWETDWGTFTSMPSRLTAEPVEQSERERLLHEVTTHGFIDNYSGIRISTTGKRFRIHQATVWNVIDPSENYLGQAVVFADYESVE